MAKAVYPKANGDLSQSGLIQTFEYGREDYVLLHNTFLVLALPGLHLEIDPRGAQNEYFFYEKKGG